MAAACEQLIQGHVCRQSLLAHSWPFKGICMLLSLHWALGFCLCVQSLHSSQYAAEDISAWLLSRTLPSVAEHLPSATCSACCPGP